MLVTLVCATHADAPVVPDDGTLYWKDVVREGSVFKLDDSNLYCTAPRTPLTGRPCRIQAIVTVDEHTRYRFNVDSKQSDSD